MVTIDSIIYVDLSALESAYENFRRALYALEEQLDRLDTGLRAGLSEWSGEARAAYDVAHAQWQTAAGDMAKTLDWLGRVIQIASKNYQSARMTNLRVWQGR